MGCGQIRVLLCAETGGIRGRVEGQSKGVTLRLSKDGKALMRRFSHYENAPSKRFKKCYMSLSLLRARKSLSHTSMISILVSTVATMATSLWILIRAEYKYVYVWSSCMTADTSVRLS
jgi:hypothetical protein